MSFNEIIIQSFDPCENYVQPLLDLVRLKNTHTHNSIHIIIYMMYSNDKYKF